MRPQMALWVGLVFVMLMGFCANTAFSQISHAKGAREVDNAELQKAQAVLAQHEARLMNVPGVVGVGLGTTEKGTHAAIHVFVNVQATGGAVPTAIPEELDRVPVRVIQTDDVKAR